MAPVQIPNMLLFRYHISKSSEQEKVGGRLFAHEFGEPHGPHDYYDVGAMRFPDDLAMTRWEVALLDPPLSVAGAGIRVDARANRTFDLFANLGMHRTNLRDRPNAPPRSTVPYYMKNVDQSSAAFGPWCHNDITRWGAIQPSRPRRWTATPSRCRQTTASPPSERRLPPSALLLL